VEGFSVCGLILFIERLHLNLSAELFYDACDFLRNLVFVRQLLFLQHHDRDFEFVWHGKIVTRQRFFSRMRRSDRAGSCRSQRLA
jgi:hypothetical protein